MKVGDKVRVRSGRKVCRVFYVGVRPVRDVLGNVIGLAELGRRFCEGGRPMDEHHHFGEEAHRGRDGHRFPLCKTCWPDGDGEEVKGG